MTSGAQASSTGALACSYSAGSRLPPELPYRGSANNHILALGKTPSKRALGGDCSLLSRCGGPSSGVPALLTHTNCEGIRVRGLKLCGATCPAATADHWRADGRRYTAGSRSATCLGRWTGRAATATSTEDEPPPRPPPVSPVTAAAPPPHLAPRRAPQLRGSGTSQEPSPPSWSAPGSPSRRRWTDSGRPCQPVQVGMRSWLVRARRTGRPAALRPSHLGPGSMTGADCGRRGPGAHAHQFLASSR